MRHWLLAGRFCPGSGTCVPMVYVLPASPDDLARILAARPGGGGILAAPDLPARNELIAGHLSRLQDSLARTHKAVTELQELLRRPGGTPEADISHRSVAPAHAAAITAVIDVADAGAWLPGALGELRATIGAQGLATAGPPGGIYAAELFTDERGRATVFVPCDGEARPAGRVEPVVVPPAELAIIVHPGPQQGIDRAYGALAAHVARRELAVDGPIREYYLTGREDTPDEAAWRTDGLDAVVVAELHDGTSGVALVGPRVATRNQAADHQQVPDPPDDHLRRPHAGQPSSASSA